MNTKLNARVSIQANKLDLTASYVARLEHRMTICTIVSITVTGATVDLWLKQRMKHISSRGPYLSSRKAANSVSLLWPYKSSSSLHLCFLSGSVQFFVFMLLFFVSLLISSL